MINKLLRDQPYIQKDFFSNKKINSKCKSEKYISCILLYIIHFFTYLFNIIYIFVYLDILHDILIIVYPYFHV